MSTSIQELPKEVVDAFLSELDPTLRNQLSDAQLERLRLLVQDAVSASVHDAAERMENLVRVLRSEARSPEIEL